MEPDLATESYSYVRVELRITAGHWWRWCCSCKMLVVDHRLLCLSYSRPFVTRERRTGSEHWRNDFTAMLHGLKTSPARTVHTCARTCHGAPRSGLCLRTQYIWRCSLFAHMYARSQTHMDEHRSWLSRREKLHARLLYRGSPAFLMAAVVLEKQQQPEV